MTTISRGGRHICSGCSTRFYDLNRKPATCPKCSHCVPIVKATVRRKRRMDSDATMLDPSLHRAVVANPNPKRVSWKM